ncbi:MAG: STAS domain-containing protein [Terriglobales bacterium]
MLRVTSEELGNSIVLRCAGRIVRGEETSLLCAAVRHRGRKIVLDLTEVDTIDAAGVGALISLQAAGIYLQLMNPAKAVREVLQVTGTDSVFEISSSERKVKSKKPGWPEPQPEPQPERGPLLLPLPAI